MKIITFYADCHLPEQARKNQEGFDWRGAIKLLEKSAAKFGYETLVVTDKNTQIDNPWLRVGDAMQDGLMMWLLRAQAAAIRAADEPSVMVSPDTLIARKLDFLFGKWHLSLLTRLKPKPIVNSVIGFTPSPALALLWDRICAKAETLSSESKEWGADIDAVVDVLGIATRENGRRRVDGLLVKFIPTTGVFESVRTLDTPVRTPIIDFKGARKSLMFAYARRL